MISSISHHSAQGPVTLIVYCMYIIMREELIFDKSFLPQELIIMAVFGKIFRNFWYAKLFNFERH